MVSTDTQADGGIRSLPDGKTVRWWRLLREQTSYVLFVSFAFSPFFALRVKIEPIRAHEVYEGESALNVWNALSTALDAVPVIPWSRHCPGP